MPSNPRPLPDRAARVRGSALWAAYGDALGFITELASSSQVKQRAGRYPIAETQPWKRRVGGRGGPTVELPAGCISDDTQLRLAVCRCIGPRGFDPQTFSEVEMTVWPSYALGAGLGSKVAAEHLKRRDASWSTNFFEADRSTYVNGGGNGAAMRVQPHVWSVAPGTDPDRLIADVVVDAVITHGHPRGILGAVWHALQLHRTLTGGVVPEPTDWVHDAQQLFRVSDIVEAHPELGGVWLGMWRQRSGGEWRTAVEETVEEITVDLHKMAESLGDRFEGSYDSAVEALEAFRKEQRGSGVKTALLGSFAAYCSRDSPITAITAIANHLGTDTDSIATMAGAIIGAAGHEPPTATIADRDYITREADRMSALSAGLRPASFPYPDLRRWAPPRTQSDALLQGAGGLAVAGLGPCVSVWEIGASSGNSSAAWEWVDLWFGQRVLIKRRERPGSLEGSQAVTPSETYATPTLLDAGVHDAHAVTARRAPPLRPEHEAEQLGPPSLHRLTAEAIDSGFDPALIGEQLLALSSRDDGVELAVAYSAILAKAVLSRRDQARRRNGEIR